MDDGGGDQEYHEANLYPACLAVHAGFADIGNVFAGKSKNPHGVWLSKQLTHNLPFRENLSHGTETTIPSLAATSDPNHTAEVQSICRVEPALLYFDIWSSPAQVVQLWKSLSDVSQRISWPLDTDCQEFRSLSLPHRYFILPHSARQNWK